MDIAEEKGGVIKTCLDTYKGHSDSIRCLILTKDQKIVSGLNDKTIKVWK